MSKLVLFQGDSITDCGRSREADVLKGNGYATMVSGMLQVARPGEYSFLNRGISGNRSIDIYARIRRDIINLKPDYLSILVGVNDVWHGYTQDNGVDAAKFEMIYSLLIEELREALPGLRIMILEPFVLKGCKTCSTEEFPDRWEYFQREVPLRAIAAKRIAEKYGLIFVPLQHIFDEAEARERSDGYWLRDGVHPTDAGHELIKRAWLEGFERLTEQ